MHIGYLKISDNNTCQMEGNGTSNIKEFAEAGTSPELNDGVGGGIAENP